MKKLFLLFALVLTVGKVGAYSLDIIQYPVLYGTAYSNPDETFHSHSLYLATYGIPVDNQRISHFEYIRVISAVVVFLHNQFSAKKFLTLLASPSRSSMKSNINSPNVSSKSPAYLYRAFSFDGITLAKCAVPSLEGRPKYIC